MNICQYEKVIFSVDISFALWEKKAKQHLFILKKDEMYTAKLM